MEGVSSPTSPPLQDQEPAEPPQNAQAPRSVRNSNQADALASRGFASNDRIGPSNELQRPQPPPEDSEGQCLHLQIKTAGALLERQQWD